MADASGAPIRTPDGPRAAPSKVRRPRATPALAGPPLMFRGDRRHTGRSPYAGPTTANVRWRFVTDNPVHLDDEAISAQPVVAPDGTIYIGSHDHFFYAVGPTGQLRWKRDLGDRVYSTALVDADGNVYVGSDDDAVFAFTSTGTLRWKLATEGDADSGLAQAPDGSLRFAAGSDLWAVRTDGTVLWRFRARSKIYSAPAVDDDGTTYVGSQDDNVYALAPDGAMRWSYRMRKDADGGPAIGDDGTVYVGGDDGNVVALDERGRPRWTTPVGGYVRAPVGLGLDGSVVVGIFGPRPRILSLDGATGAVRWFFPVTIADSAEVGISSSPLIDRDGNVYCGAHDDFLYALDAGGHLRWVLETGGDVDSAPVLGPDGTLYVGSDDGVLYALRDP
jgi:outer membrane protein assembly factor BamB